MSYFDPDVYSPYPCYPAQRKIMHEIYAALMDEQIYLLEGACGTGKTLSALIPAISVAKLQKKLVVIVTNVNEQKKQFIIEAKEIRVKSKVNIIVLTGKMAVCYFNNVQKSVWQDEDITYTECERLRDSDECKPYNHVKGKCDDGGNEDDAKKEAAELELKFENWIYSSVRTSEEIATWGVDHTACTYSLVWKALSKADVVICDLRIVLNEQFMKIFTLFSGKSLSDMIIIFDEAHNIEKGAKDIYERSISDNTLLKGISEISDLIQAIRDKRIFSLDMRELERTLEFLQVVRNSVWELEISSTDLKRLEAGYEEIGVSIAAADLPYNDRPDAFWDIVTEHVKFEGDEYIRERVEALKTISDVLKQTRGAEDAEHNSTSKLSSIHAFLADYIKLTTRNGYYPYLSLQRTEKNTIIRRLKIHLSLPTIITAPVLNTIHAGVLMSATLEPFATLKKVLGIERKKPVAEHTVGLQFPVKNRRTYVVLRDPTKDSLAKTAPDSIDQTVFQLPDRLVRANDHNPATHAYIRDSLDAIIEAVKYNVLVFFKNKEHAALYGGQLKTKYGDRVVLNLESKSVGETKELFFRMGEDEKRGVLCTYLGGSLAEGVDFKDKRARIVVVVGIGYTNRDMLTVSDETAYEIEFARKIGWEYVVNIPTVRKIRQAMGRVIRSHKDYGIRILIDRRFTRQNAGSIQSKFTVDERREMVVLNVPDLKERIQKDFALFEGEKDISV